MRLSLRDPKGVEVDHAVIDDPKDAVYNGMRVLARRPSFDVGSLLVVDDDRSPNLDNPKVEPVVTADNLVALAGRLEARAKMIGDTQPGIAMDLRVAAKLCRHAVKVGWVFTSVSLVA
jgi:hypothetical protein